MHVPQERKAVEKAVSECYYAECQQTPQALVMLAHLDMLNAKSLYYTRWKHPAGKSTPEDGIELLVKASNSQAFKIKRLGFEQLCCGKAFLSTDLDVGIVWCGRAGRPA